MKTNSFSNKKQQQFYLHSIISKDLVEVLFATIEHRQVSIALDLDR